MALFLCIQTSIDGKYRYIYNERTEVIKKVLSKYENIMGDVNIDLKILNSDKFKLESIIDLFSLTNLIHSKICFVKNSKFWQANLSLYKRPFSRKQV